MTDGIGNPVKDANNVDITTNIQDDPNFNNAYTYRGYRYDGESVLYFLNSRYYSAGIGRFLTKDSVLGNDSDPKTLNRYAYAQGDPINFIDPSGHNSFALGGIISFGVATLEFGIGDLILIGVALYLGYEMLTSDIPSTSSSDWMINVSDTLPLTGPPNSYLDLPDKKNPEKVKQRRYYNKDGAWPTKDIEPTDHGTPKVHKNPHAHDWDPLIPGHLPENQRNLTPEELDQNKDILGFSSYKSGRTRILPF